MPCGPASASNGGPYWQAEYWISAARDCALHLACRRRGLIVYHGRGFDDLPPDVQENFKGCLVTSLGPEELLRALGSTIDGLLQEVEDVQDLAAKVEPQLRMLTMDW